jgi:hypothetical protein
MRWSGGLYIETEPRVPSNGLALSCAAPVDREGSRAETASKIATILGPRSGVSWSTLLGGSGGAAFIDLNSGSAGSLNLTLAIKVEIAVDRHTAVQWLVW